MKAPAHVDTTRLTLRPPERADARQMFERYESDPDVTRFLGWPRHRTVDETEAFVRFSAAEWSRWPAGPYLITSRTDGQVLGSTGFGFRTPHEAVTVCVGPGRLGKGRFVPDEPSTQQAEFPNLAPGVQQDALCYVLTIDGASSAAGQLRRSARA